MLSGMPIDEEDMGEFYNDLEVVLTNKPTYRVAIGNFHSKTRR